MSARRGAALLALAVAGCAPAEPHTASRDPRADGKALAASCEGRDGWSDPAPPARIWANVHYVGTCGITVLLVTSPAGHVLIDGATAKAAPGIVDNIRRLGFDPRDVRYLLSGHEHDDHAGGLAELRRLTGAQLIARDAARQALQSGTIDEAEPQHGVTQPFEGTPVTRVVRDGEVVRLGPLALTAHATPGHTGGSTSWTWAACEGETCRTLAYADSLTAVSADGYRFSDNPELVSTFRATFDRVAALDCDILITPHPSASDLFPRSAGKAPLADRNACAAYAADARRRLDERLAKEGAR